MPKRNWTIWDKLIITKRLWTGCLGGAHTYCGKCGSVEITIKGPSEHTPISTKQGNFVRSVTVEMCRKCGAYGVLNEVWEPDLKSLKTAISAIAEDEGQTGREE